METKNVNVDMGTNVNCYTAEKILRKVGTEAI